jgi:hypothetical protein
LDIGEVLSVPRILGQTNNGVELDEKSILLFSNHPTVVARQIPELMS